MIINLEEEGSWAALPGHPLGPQTRDDWVGLLRNAIFRANQLQESVHIKNKKKKILCDKNFPGICQTWLARKKGKKKMVCNYEGRIIMVFT